MKPTSYSHLCFIKYLRFLDRQLNKIPQSKTKIETNTYPGISHWQHKSCINWSWTFSDLNHCDDTGSAGHSLVTNHAHHPIIIIVIVIIKDGQEPQDACSSFWLVQYWFKMQHAHSRSTSITVKKTNFSPKVHNKIGKVKKFQTSVHLF